MSYSSRKKVISPRTKYFYNKWRLATLAFNIVGLMVFLFSLSAGTLRPAMMAASVVILWAGVYVSYRYMKLQEGKHMHGMARNSMWISALLAVVISVLTTITLVP